MTDLNAQIETAVDAAMRIHNAKQARQLIHEARKKVEHQAKLLDLPEGCADRMLHLANEAEDVEWWLEQAVIAAQKEETP